jgi:multidrug efflux pump subunit AcrB
VFLIRASLANPHLVVVTVLGICLFGLINLARLPVDIFPDLKQPMVALIYNFRGMPAREMERNVTRRMERLLTQVPYLDHIESRSLNGIAVIKVYFKAEADAGASAGYVANLAASIQRRMPPGMLPPVVMAVDPANVPVCQVVLSSDIKDDTALLVAARTVIRPRLGAVAGASVGSVFGGKERRIMIYLNRDALQAKGLSPMDVVNAIDVGNVMIPAGNAPIGDKDIQLSTNAMLPSGPAFGDIPIKVVDGAPVYIRDVAVAEDSGAIQTSIVRVGGRRMVYIPVMRQIGANAISVVDGVRAAIAKMPGLDDDVKLEVAFDQSQVVRSSIAALSHEGLLGGGLACVMVLVFLASFRSTFVIGLSIPVSVLAAFIGLALGGQTINTMTLGGLALSVGTLIDNSIVVLENISRHLGMGKKPQDAARDGASEVARPVAIATLVNLAVYLPVLFLAGIGKYLFTPLAISVFFAMTASLVASLTVVPAYCANFLKTADHRHGRRRTFGERLARVSEHSIELLSASYARLLSWWMGRRALFALLSAAVFAFSLLLYPMIGKEFFPRVDTGQFILHVRAPAGTRLEKTEEYAAGIEERIRAVCGDDLQVMVTNIGLAADTSAISNPNPGTDGGFIQVQLRSERIVLTDESLAALIAGGVHPSAAAELAPLRNRVFGTDAELVEAAGALLTPEWVRSHGERLVRCAVRTPVTRPTSEYVEDLRADLAKHYPEIGRFFQTGGIVSAVLNNGLRASIDIQVQGTVLGDTDAVARSVEAAISGIPGVAEIAVVQNLEAPTVRVELDRAKTAQTGLTTEDALKNLVTAMSSSINFARTLWIDPKSGDGYYVAVQYRDKEIDSFDDLQQVPVTPMRRGSPPVLMQNLIEISRDSGTTEVAHYNIQRVYNIHVEVQGRDVGSVAAEIEARLAELESGFTAKMKKEHPIALRGEVAGMKTSFAGLGFGLVLAVVTVYLIMVPQFRSFLDPFLVLFAVPMGLAGVLWVLYLTGTTLNIQSYIGAIMMVGICAANSILLVDFANNLTAQGLSVREAAVQAGKTRLRPILMTALAASLGLAPMAFAGKGGEANAPLARAVIGGLLLSTLFTLFLVPVLYTLFKRRSGVAVADATDSDIEASAHPDR